MSPRREPPGLKVDILLPDFRAVALTEPAGHAHDVLALEGRYAEAWVEGRLERSGEDDPDEERLYRDRREDDSRRGVVVESLGADCEVRIGRPAGR